MSSFAAGGTTLPRHKPKPAAAPADLLAGGGAAVAVRVLLPYPFVAPFDYLASAALGLVAGDAVLVPLRQGTATGIVWDADPAAGPVPARLRLKTVIARIDVPPMPAVLRQFVAWVAGYTLANLGDVLAMALRVRNFGVPSAVLGYAAAPQAVMPARLTAQRARVLAVLRDGAVRGAHDIAAAADVSPGVIRAMAEAGLLLHLPMAADAAFAHPDPMYAIPDLSADQALAAAVLEDGVAARQFCATLLEGVTGSGKTEVYLQAVAAAILAGRQALVLVPEIALSTQFLARFTARFGAVPAVWHSDLSPRTRQITWRAVAEGRAPVVIGARSALFLPFPDLGLIVVDEEHDSGFKQEDGVIYHARDMAVVRARLGGAPVVLVSATPSLESLANAEAGRYAHVRLTTRHGGAALPAIHMIDMRDDTPQRGDFLAPMLVAKIRETLARGEQAMLFLNRRGYAPLTLCRACGHKMQCPNCTAWLVEHRARGELACHHCGHSCAQPSHCPQCKAAGTLRAVGPGVERITEEAARLFPEARRLVMASDTMPGPHAAAEAARAIVAREIDVIIGTQIVAKGWHFPHLTLVGVVDADLGLAGADLRAGERCVQLLHQVAGRGGGAGAPGQVYLQSYSPEHAVMQALISGDIAGFQAAEIAQRRPGHWPPFGRLAAVIVSAEDENAAERAARDLGRGAPHGDGIVVLGPAAAPLAILRGRYRFRLLLKTRKDIAVQPILRAWLAAVNVAGNVRVDVDVDPVSFM